MRFLTARLSTRRRSPLAGLVVLLLGLLMTGGLYAALSPAQADTETADQATLAKGKALFLVGCASCHGKNAEGVVAAEGHGQYGPPLIGVGAAAVDFQMGTGRMPMAQPGPQAAAKRPLYDADEISAVAAYIASLGPGPAIPSPDEYDTADATNEQIVRGGQFFLTNCTACHNFAASGGALPQGKHAPSLDGVSSKHIYEALITGPQQMPVFSDAVLKPQEKRDIIAYLKSIEEMPKYGGVSNLGKLGPVSEGFFAWVIGIGSLVGVAVWIASHSVRAKKGVKA